MRPTLTDQQVSTFQARICSVVETLFDRHGVEGVSMRRIAAKLGYSATALYRYFPDKEAILAAVRAAALNRFAARLEAAARSSAEPRAEARAVGREYLRFALEEPKAYRLVFDVNQPDSGRYPELTAATQRAQNCMRAYVQDLIDAGELQGDARTLGYLFWAAAHGLVMLHLSGMPDPDFDLEHAHQQAMRLLFRGTQVTPATAKAPSARSASARSRSTRRGSRTTRRSGR